MIKALLFAFVFLVVGLVVWSVLAPLLFRGADFEKLGAMAFPVILLVCGGMGFFYGLRRGKRK
jgi:hypothetical protein